jgi:hypothetical protein
MSRISLLIDIMNIAAKTNGGSIKVSSEWLTALSDCINSELELTKAIAAKSVEQPANGSVSGGQGSTNTLRDAIKCCHNCGYFNTNCSHVGCNSGQDQIL